MSDIMVKVEGLSKKYIISHETREGYTALRDVISKKAKGLVKGNKNLPAKEEFWAIKDVSFEIKKGDAVGIIGRNGAGKSTLLKMLSRITEPSGGRIELSGRVASLLEVGTGFHPELTGRENIFLNGAILGMSRAEIRRKFDEIVDFSGVEKFLDTPVKRYSSGMYVRLAFAVAAHLEPEILVVDEVLAVGDAEFQKKCLGKMKDVSAKEGRTVLFVSHNMAAVKQLCNKGILLNSGMLAFDGGAVEAVNQYQSADNTSLYFDHQGPLEDAPGNNNIRILKFEVSPLKGDVISVSSGIQFELKFYNGREKINLDSTFEIRNIEEVVISHHGALLSQENNSIRGVYTVIGKIPPYTLNAGTYKFKLIFGENQRYALYVADDFVQFDVANEAIGSNTSQLPGVLRLNTPYEVTFNEIA